MFNDVFLRDYLLKIKDEAYAINLHDTQSKRTHWVSLFIGNTVLNFDFFGNKYIPQELLNKIKDKFITRHIFRIQDDDSIICRFYVIAFIEYMLLGESLLDYTNLFSPNSYKKNDKIMCKDFQDKYNKRKRISWIKTKKIRWSKKSSSQRNKT